MTTTTIKTHIIRVGNSAAVRIPKYMLKTAGLEAGQPVEIFASEGCITVRACQKALTYDLDQLLSGIAAENRHHEFSFGKPAGKEAL